MGRPADTSADAQERLDALISAMTPSERSRRAIELTDTVAAIAESGIRQRHPEYSDAEVRLCSARARLGDALFREAFPGAPLLPA